MTRGFVIARFATLLTLIGIVVPAVANAQYLWIEAARDPGRAEVPATARQLGTAGGSIALGNRRAGIGLSLYGIHLGYVIQSDESVEFAHRVVANQPLTVDFSNVRYQLKFDDWSTGFSVSGHVAVGKTAAVIARWRHEPRFRAAPVGGLRIDFDLPDTLGAGWILRQSALTVVAEVSWHEYGAADFVRDDYPFPREKFFCGGLRDSDPCGMRNTFVVRSGVEQGVRLGKGRLLLRGGVAYEPAYTFAREHHPWGFGRSLTPSEPTWWDPPREDLIWISGGAAYSWSHTEIGVGMGHANDQLRLLADFRLHR